MTTSLRHLIGLGLLLLAGAAHAASVSIDLYAKGGTTTLPDGTSVAVLGYTTGATGATDAIAAPGGPTLAVSVGDTVTVTLHNGLTEASGLVLQGQGLIPDTVGVAGGGSTTYSFTVTSPGTFLYEAAPLANAQHQAAMGLAGALVVRPATATQAYDSAATAFTKEAVLVLSELDPALNAAPAIFDMRNYAPKYFLINGKAYPATASIPAVAGDKVLLRYVNAGVRHHSMTLLGLEQLVVAKDGSPLAYPGKRVAETVAPGQTMDAIATIPAGATGQFALYDGNLALFNNRAAGFGGMLTFLAAGGTPPAAGPTVTALSLVGTGVTATITAGAGRTVTAAQAWVDAGAPITMALVAGSWTATIPAPSAGSHLLSARGQDDLGTWGSARTLTFSVDTAGPATTGLVLAPNPSNGTVAVVLTGTGDDRATGGANLASWEYSIDGGTAVAATLPNTSPVASLSATIAQATVNALSVGAHVVSVRSRDALGNWGAAATASLVVDKAGPATTNVAASPNPNNGALPFNSSSAVVRVTADLVDAASNIAAAEGFIDTVGASGSGFPFIPSDGLFGSLSETGYADIPLGTINSLASGNHTIHVHGRDAAGNWGATASTALLIDRTAPTFASISVAPNPAFSPSPATLTVNGASDPLVGGLASGVAGGEWWLGTTNPAPGGGTAFSGTTASLPTASLATGSYAVHARIRDAAGNWSTNVANATLNVLPEQIFADGFESPNTLPGNWTSRSTNNTSRLNNTTAAALVGTRGLQAQGNNTNFVQYNFGTTANPATATFDARFYFRPNGNSSTGKDILAVANNTNFNSGNILFRVRYRLNGSTPQVQIQVGNTTNTTWTALTGGATNNAIEVVYQASGTLRLYVNGAPAQTLTTGTGSATAVRMGSVTSNGNATLMYFDAFSAKRSATPLYGP